MYIFLYSKWMSLELPTRHAIARVLDIPKSGPTHVQDNRIVSDGYVMEAVEAALDPKNIQKVLDADTDNPEELWDLLVHTAAFVAPKVAPTVEVVVETPVEPVVEEKPEPTLEDSNAKPEKIKVIKEEVSPAKKPAKTAKKAAPKKK